MSLLGNFPNRAIILFLSNCFRLYKVIFYYDCKSLSQLKFFCKMIVNRFQQKENRRSRKEGLYDAPWENPMIHPLYQKWKQVHLEDKKKSSSDRKTAWTDDIFVFHKNCLFKVRIVHPYILRQIKSIQLQGVWEVMMIWDSQTKVVYLLTCSVKHLSKT